MNPVTAAPDSGTIAPMSGPATIGESCVDRYLPPIGLDAPGGNALNVAAGLAAAGLTVAHVGAVGDDDEGRFVLARAAERGIDTTHLAVVPGGRTGLTTITVTPDGDRVFDRKDVDAVEVVRIPNRDGHLVHARGQRILPRTGAGTS